jgi:hypothetical protein
MLRLCEPDAVGVHEKRRVSQQASAAKCEKLPKINLPFVRTDCRAATCRNAELRSALAVGGRQRFLDIAQSIFAKPYSVANRKRLERDAVTSDAAIHLKPLVFQLVADQELPRCDIQAFGLPKSKWNPTFCVGDRIGAHQPAKPHATRASTTPGPAPPTHQAPASPGIRRNVTDWVTRPCCMAT